MTAIPGNAIERFLDGARRRFQPAQFEHFLVFALWSLAGRIRAETLDPEVVAGLGAFAIAELHLGADATPAEVNSALDAYYAKHPVLPDLIAGFGVALDDLEKESAIDTAIDNGHLEAAARTLGGHAVRGTPAPDDSPPEGAVRAGPLARYLIKRSGDS